MKRRIRHIYPHAGAFEADPRVPRGWIMPDGQFFETKEHWASINSHFRRPDTRAKFGEEAAEEAEAAERMAHLAYSLGWISVGHSGKLNAIGHQKTFRRILHPAVTTLRRLLEQVPALTIEIELQVGEFVPSRGVHEDFELLEFDLNALIRRGWLRRPR